VEPVPLLVWGPPSGSTELEPPEYAGWVGGHNSGGGDARRPLNTAKRLDSLAPAGYTPRNGQGVNLLLCVPTTELPTRSDEARSLTGKNLSFGWASFVKEADNDG